MSLGVVPATATGSRSACSQICRPGMTVSPNGCRLGRTPVAQGDGRPHSARLAEAVLDVASGTAGVALQLADRTSSHVVGVDLTPSMLKIGQRNVALAIR